MPSPVLRFKCTGCGACCTGAADHCVEVSDREREAIRLHLRLSPGWFRRRYLQRLDHGWGLRLGASGRCPFLGDDNRCGVYALRPAQCRTYPLWPELLGDRRAWNAEARRCEGMNQGPRIARKKIAAVLKDGG